MKKLFLMCLVVLFSLVLFAATALASEASPADEVASVQPDATIQQVSPVTVEIPERFLEMADISYVTHCTGEVQETYGRQNEQTASANYTLNAKNAYTENAKAPQSHVILLWSTHRDHSIL